MRRLIALLGGVLVLSLAPARPLRAWSEDAEPDPAQKDRDEEQEQPEKEKGKKKKSKGPRLEMRTHPSFRVGKWLRTDFRVKFLQDFRSFDPEFFGDEGDTTNLKKMRVGVEGYITKSFEYEVEREIRNEVSD